MCLICDIILAEEIVPTKQTNGDSGDCMTNGITYHNKDVLFKVLSQHYENKSLAVYGLILPRIKRLLSGNYPSVTATEIHADNPFLLEDDSLLILEYESTVKNDDFLKYNKYVTNALERLWQEGIYPKKVIIAVIYTSDVETAPSTFDVDALRIQIEQVFLTKFNTDKIFAELKVKVENGETLTDDDVMRLIILPLTLKGKEQKQQFTREAINIARQIQDEHQQLFIVAGIMTATNKFLDHEYAEMLKGWIKMTKVAKLFEEEKIEAVNTAVNTTDKNVRIQIARNMLTRGDDILEVMQITGLTRSEIDSMLAPVGA